MYSNIRYTPMGNIQLAKEGTHMRRHVRSRTVQLRLANDSQVKGRWVQTNDPNLNTYRIESASYPRSRF